MEPVQTASRGCRLCRVLVPVHLPQCKGLSPYSVFYQKSGARLEVEPSLPGGPSASGSHFHRPEATPFQLVQRGCDPAGEVLQSSPLLGLYSLGIMSGS